MRAVTIAEGLVVAERPDPEPGSGELLVRVRAAGINGADLHQVGGRYPVPPGSLSDIPGLELAGEVAAVGPGVLRFGPGDRVMAVVGGGGQAELAVVHERAAPVPAGSARGRRAPRGRHHRPTPCSPRPASARGAAAGPRRRRRVGTAAVQLGAAGARVVASVRNPEHHQAVVELGPPWSPTPAFGHGPFDVILELVGAPTSRPSGRPGHRRPPAGHRRRAGAGVEVDLRTLMARWARVLASAPAALEEKADAARRVERQALPWSPTAARIPVAATFPWSGPRRPRPLRRRRQVGARPDHLRAGGRGRGGRGPGGGQRPTRHDWAGARERFTAARTAEELAAADLDALADAAWWLGEAEEAVAVFEAAYRRHLDDGRPDRAAMAAIGIAVTHLLRGDGVVGSGWLGRAQRLVRDEPEGVAHGYLLYLELEGALGATIPAPWSRRPGGSGRSAAATPTPT